MSFTIAQRLDHEAAYEFAQTEGDEEGDEE